MGGAALLISENSLNLEPAKAQLKGPASNFSIPIDIPKVSEEKFNSDMKRIKLTGFYSIKLGEATMEKDWPSGYRELCNSFMEKIDWLCKQNKSPKPIGLSLLPVTLNILRGINSFVNKEIVPISDDDSFARPEYWDHNKYRRFGDCEEYVRRKILFLLKQNFQPESLAPAFVLYKNIETGKEEGHLVLLVTMEHEDKQVTFVLDNLNSINNPNGDILTIDQVNHLKFVSVLNPEKTTWNRVQIKRN